MERLKLIVLFFVFIIAVSCSDDPAAVKEPIIIDFISLSDSAIVNNKNELNISAFVSQPEEIKKLELFADGKFVAGLSSSPYEFKWTPDSVKAYSLQLIGLTGSDSVKSEVLRVFAVSNSLPFVDLGERHFNGCFVGNAIPYQPFSYSPNGPIKKIELFANSIFVASDSVAPFLLNWIPTASGTYSLKAIAYDSKGVKGESQVITEEVKTGIEAGGSVELTFYNTSVLDGPDAEIKGWIKETNPINTPEKQAYVVVDGKYHVSVDANFEFTIKNFGHGKHVVAGVVRYNKYDSLISKPVDLHFLETVDFKCHIGSVVESQTHIIVQDSANGNIISISKSYPHTVTYDKYSYTDGRILSISNNRNEIYTAIGSKLLITNLSAKAVSDVDVGNIIKDIKADDSRGFLYLLFEGKVATYDLTKKAIVSEAAVESSTHLQMDAKEEWLFALNKNIGFNHYKFSISSSGQLNVLERGENPCYLWFTYNWPMLPSQDGKYMYATSIYSYEYSGMSLIRFGTSQISTINNRWNMNFSAFSISKDGKSFYLLQEGVIKEYLVGSGDFLRNHGTVPAYGSTLMLPEYNRLLLISCEKETQGSRIIFVDL